MTSKDTSLEELDRVYRLPPNRVRDLFVQQELICEFFCKGYKVDRHVESELINAGRDRKSMLDSAAALD